MSCLHPSAPRSSTINAVTRRARRPLVGLISIAFVLGACSSGDEPSLVPGDAAVDGAVADGAGQGEPTAPEVPTPEPLPAVALCTADPAARVAAVADPSLEEISGLAIDGPPRRGVWAIEDSGNDAALIRIGFDGAIRQRVTLEVPNTDWEDLAFDARTGELVVADTGNNLRERSPVLLHAVTAPRRDATVSATTTTVTYPDQIPDVEALLIDPLTGDRFLVSKALDQRDFSFESDTVVYRVPAGAGADGATVVAEEVARLQLGLVRTVTGGDIAADGSVLVLRTYDTVLVWDRPPGTTIAGALGAEPCEAPSPRESMGEAIALTANGRGYVTIGEDVNATIWQVG